MPFKSKAQQAYLEINKPEVAKEFASHTKNYKKLPEHVKPKSKHKKTYGKNTLKGLSNV